MGYSNFAEVGSLFLCRGHGRRLLTRNFISNFGVRVKSVFLSLPVVRTIFSLLPALKSFTRRTENPEFEGGGLAGKVQGNCKALKICNFSNLHKQLNINWLPCIDSNYDKVIQNHLCYHYTTRQLRERHSKDPGPFCKRIFRPRRLPFGGRPAFAAKTGPNFPEKISCAAGWGDFEYPSLPMDTILESRELQVERKHFFLEFRENDRGRFLRITEEAHGRRNTVIIPSTGLEEFERLLNEVLAGHDARAEAT